MTDQKEKRVYYVAYSAVAKNGHVVIIGRCEITCPPLDNMEAIKAVEDYLTDEDKEGLVLTWWTELKP